jgi:uncharacterized membrane protein YeaQ/YmgE (transglycosylase-associated protein family)
MIWLVAFIAIGALAAWLARAFMRGSGFGLLGDVIVGAIGACIGAYVFRATGAEIGGGPAGSLIVAFAGALLLLFVVRLFIGRRPGRFRRSHS